MFPAVLVTGPRQAGKTTLLRHEMGGTADYVSFDDPLERSFAVADPQGFLDRFSRPVILDEIQYVPELFQYLKMRIDRDRNRNGRWLLTGSQQFQLMRNISESLAGRIAILDLLPFSLMELKTAPLLENLLWYGGYPDPLLHHDKRDLWVRSYIQTYIERDVRQLQHIRDLRAFEAFIAISAARHGQTFNAAAIAREVGVTLPTVKSWAGILEASYLGWFLPPYFRNFGKRLVKTPKMYYLDPAIVCDLTRQPDAKSALSGAMGGALFEGLIVSEAVKVFAARGMRPDIYFWRSNDGMEVDLLVRVGGRLHPVEIKLTATPSERHLEPLNRFRSLARGEAADTGLLVCRVSRQTPLPSKNMAIPWQMFPEWLDGRITGQ